jgi:hypothetical protein
MLKRADTRVFAGTISSKKENSARITTKLAAMTAQPLSLVITPSQNPWIGQYCLFWFRNSIVLANRHTEFSGIISK